jgi:DNA-3-methyladenine glycosylase II
MLEEKAIVHLSKDKRFKKIIETTTITYRLDSEDVYLSLMRAISAQQLSSKAASTIFGRFLNLFEDEYPLPDILMWMTVEELRAVGLSRQKANYMINVATFFSENKLMNFDWSEWTDDEIIEKLTAIKGVGKWTVQMILIFSLRRLDVYPVDDLVVRQNTMKLYKVDDTLRGKKLHKELYKIAEKWKPYRSVASRYLWEWESKKAK